MNLESIKLLKSIPITHNEKVSKRTINMLYKSLTNALESWEKNHEKNALKEEIDYSNNSKFNEISDYHHIHSEIRNRIEKYGCYYQHYDIHINDHVYKILLYLPIHEEYSIINKLKIKKFFFDCLFKIYLWLFVVQPHIREQCSDILHINIILSNHKKQIHKKEIFDTIHANSAFTTSCKKEASICIYRLEEWFKVFIHESFHSLGLDFSNFDDEVSESILFQMFQVENKRGLRVYESYCETWAEVLNLFIISYLQTDNKEQFSKQFHLLLKKELQFSFFQLVKVLENYNLTYEELIDNSSTIIKFKEHTHILSYYVIKLILMYNINEFEKWCYKNNNTLFQFGEYSQIMLYIDLIKKLYKNEHFLKYIKKVEKFTNEKMDKHLNNELKCTMRMTVVEI